MTGVGDPTFRVSVNFYGAPAISMDEFLTSQQDIIVGASLQVTALITPGFGGRVYFPTGKGFIVRQVMPKQAAPPGK